jgi:hypothetical protein
MQAQKMADGEDYQGEPDEEDDMPATNNAAG